MFNLINYTKIDNIVKKTFKFLIILNVMLMFTDYMISIIGIKIFHLKENNIIVEYIFHNNFLFGFFIMSLFFSNIYLMIYTKLKNKSIIIKILLIILLFSIIIKSLSVNTLNVLLMLG